MRVLRFDLKGKMAHFRPFYTNANSLSYGFPPRSTIAGLLAGIMGFPRDQYYDEFSPDRAKISVRLMTPIRRIMYSVNYVRTKKGDWSLKKILEKGFETYPMSIQVILPENGDFLDYRIYFAHEDEEFFRELVDAISEGGKYFPYLGITEFLAWIDNVEVVDGNQTKSRVVHSVAPFSIIEKVDFSRTTHLLVDKMVGHFQVEGGFRKPYPGATGEYAYNPDAKPIYLREEIPVVAVGEENIIWL